MQQMRLLNQLFRALLKRINRPGIWRVHGLLPLSLIFLAGCSGGMSSFPRVANFFGEASATPTPAASPTPIATTPTVPSPAASDTTVHPGRKSPKQTRAASENTAAASKRSAVSSRETPSSAPSTAAPSAGVVSAMRTTPTLSSSALESSGSTAEGNPEKAAKLIQDIDQIENRVDRRNLSSDDSQRDILAQKLLQEAKKSLAEHDSVAAMSLATKASTLLAPLPKLADSDIPSSP